MASPANRPNGIAVQGRRAREFDAPTQEAGGAGYVEEAGRGTPNLLAVVWRQRWIVLLCCLLALSGGVAYLTQATPIYASSSIVYVQQSTPKIMSDVMSTGQRTIGYLFTQCQVIESTAILRSALGKPGVSDLATLRGSANPVATLKYIVRAEPDKQGDLIGVSAESTVPQDAATIVNAVVDSYIEYQGSQHKSTAVEVMRILQKEVDRYESALKDNAAAMLKLKRENPDLAFTTDHGTSPVATRLNEIADTVTKAQLRSLDLQTALAEARLVKDDPYQLKRLLDQFGLANETVPAVDPGLLSEYRQERARLDELLARFGPRHEQVQASQRQLARLESEVADATRGMAASYLALLEQALKANDARITDLENAAKQVRTSAVDLNIKQVEFDQISQDSQRIERSLDLLDSRMKDVNVTEDVGAMSVSVLEVAQASDQPVRPLRSKTLLLSLVAGLMAGVGLALLRDALDHRLRTVDEITAALDLPMLGAIPHIGGRGSNVERGRIVHALPRSAVAEAFRTLRTGVYFAIPENVSAKTILVTSPAPGDGKSTTASNLAIAFAQAGRRVLLIDADCRRPTQHRIHAIASAPGLSTILAGGGTLSDTVKPTSIERLSLLPAGEIPANPAELLDSVAFNELLNAAAAEYDQVIIDSPPIVPVTDARVIAARADAVVLVLRAERSTRRLANHAREALISVGARVIGVVVSDVPRGNHSYGYDYYGAGRYGYSSVKIDVGSPGEEAGQRAGAERVTGEIVSEPVPPVAKRSKR